MSVRMRHTSSHTKNRRSHHALKNQVIVKDKESGKARLPHRLDESTGMYRGKLIVPAKTKKQSVKASEVKEEKVPVVEAAKKEEKPKKVNKRGK